VLLWVIPVTSMEDPGGPLINRILLAHRGKDTSGRLARATA
jgi:hypothetical protein